MSDTAQSPNANWLNDLQHQMDALKLKINDLQSPAIKPEIRSPHCHPISHNQLSKEEPHNRSNKNTEDPLGLRRRKREQDSKNFRNFLRAQRQQVIRHPYFSDLERFLRQHPLLRNLRNHLKSPVNKFWNHLLHIQIKSSLKQDTT